MGQALGGEPINQRVFPLWDKLLITIAAGGIVLLALLGCLGPGGGREGPRIIHQVDKPRWAEEVRERATAVVEEPELISLGTYTCYAYCPCESCCGQWSGGPTASGTIPVAGRTVAADWDVLPAGTDVYIDGLGWRTVEDTGAGITGDKLDVYFDSHQEALEFGVKNLKIWMKGDQA